MVGELFLLFDSFPVILPNYSTGIWEYSCTFDHVFTHKVNWFLSFLQKE